MATAARPILDTVSPTIDRVVMLPKDGTSAVVMPEPGAYTQFMFKMDQIETVATRQDGALEMKLTNGSTLVVGNFQDLVNSAESCGRDTVLQFLADRQMADGAVVPKIVNIAPDALAEALDPALANSNTVVIHEPNAGVTREVVMSPGKTYQMDFDWAGTAKTVDGTNMLVSFKNGGLVILRDFVPAMNGDLPPTLTLQNGAVIESKQLLATVCTPEGEPVVAAKVHDTPHSKLRAPDVEPAAGEPVAKKTAPSVADIEPAAGDGAGALSGGRGGVGFASGIDAAVLAGLNPLGPLGPTTLLYGLPGVADAALARGPVVPTSAPPPPVTETPTLVVNGARVYEDGSVGLNIATTTPTGTTSTLTISGIADGWTVQPGLGTYDAATRTWSITLGSGVDFTGGPTLIPPTNADGDLTGLTVRLTAVDTANSVGTTLTGAVNVVTDAVADAPTLDVTANTSGTQGTPIPLTITSDLVDIDGSEVLSVRIGGLPTGSVLSVGTVQPDGTWILTPGQLVGLTVTPPATYQGNFTVTVTAIATETNFSGTEFDLTNNVATRSQNINVIVTPVVVDGTPTIQNQVHTIDETNLGPIIINGSMNANYGPDGAGSIELISAVPSGSLKNGELTSGGVPLRVEQNGNTYTGYFGADVGFVFTLRNDGTYVFTQYMPIDHADGSNANDIITITLGVQIRDADGDINTATITTHILDDAPVANDDVVSMRDNATIDGNLLFNDTISEDSPVRVMRITFGGMPIDVPATGSVSMSGDYGTLTVAANGAYSYTSFSNVAGNDVFTYTIIDGDGDTDTATLSFGVLDQTNDTPVIGDVVEQVDETDIWQRSGASPEVTGDIGYSYGLDGAGSITPSGAFSFSATGSILNGVLSMSGYPITVRLVGNTYKGQVTYSDGDIGDIFDLTINPDGTYRFVLLNTLDHADGTNPNDMITLNFGVTIRDADGDTDTGVVSIQVRDDAPVANNDVASVNASQVVTGDVIGNDLYSYDDMWVRSVTFNGQTVNLVDDGGVYSTIVGVHGTLQINSAGGYIYTANAGASGTDVFTYLVRDIDGDPATATLTIGVTAVVDGTPIIGDAERSVEEMNHLGLSVNGSLGANYGSDGPGAVTPVQQNGFSASGSLKNGVLTANGVPVTVQISGNDYVGMAGVEAVFRLSLKADGTYDFHLYSPLDHADPTHPNDVIDLNFNVQISDVDGDVDTGIVKIHIIDGAPVANDDRVMVSSGQVSYGNVTNNDIASDDSTLVSKIEFRGQTYVIPLDGTSVSVEGDYGRLLINKNGSYSYVANALSAKTVYLDANAGDVALAADPEISLNGITVTAINPNTRATIGDLTWTYGDLYIDGTWYGENGIGVDGNGNKFVNGLNEGLRVAFDVPHTSITLHISAWNSFSDDASKVEPYLSARVYLDGQTDPVLVTLEQGTYSGYGFVSYKLDSSQFGGKSISSVELYTTRADADWNLCNVSFDQTSGGGTDQFVYTFTDYDGDSDTGVLALNTTKQSTSSGVLAVEDDITLAIEDFVIATGVETSVTDGHQGQDSSFMLMSDVRGLDDPQQNQTII